MIKKKAKRLESLMQDTHRPAHNSNRLRYLREKKSFQVVLVFDAEKGYTKVSNFRKVGKDYEKLPLEFVYQSQ